MKPPRQTPVAFLIVDDHPLVRRGLKDILTEAYPHAVFGEAADSSGALRTFNQRKWDVVLLDINIPGRGGLDVLEDLLHIHPQASILIVSSYPEEEFSVQAFKLGAAGYLNKNQATEELVVAVRTVLAGSKYITASIAQRLAESLRGKNDAIPHECLSPRELQVLRLVATGKSAKHIADALAVSEKTVATYRARIAQKIGLANNVELTRYAFQHGLTQ
jgi:two-component system, NarL family, invasion response regulator UvrY